MHFLHFNSFIAALVLFEMVMAAPVPQDAGVGLDVGVDVGVGVGVDVGVGVP